MNNKFYKDWFIISFTFLLGSLVSLQSEFMWNYGSYSNGYDPWTDVQPCRKVTAFTGQHIQKKRGQIHMPREGFKCMTPVFEWTKIFYTLDHETTVIGVYCMYSEFRKTTTEV
jgi:hypothetical protein